jgi:hypothetical protein
MALLNRTFSELLDFTRATTATFVGSNGLIQTAAIDAPRFTYDPVTLEGQGLLIEEQRTNLLKYSEKMDESVYRRLNVNVTPNAAISPNNATEGDKLVADNNDDIHWFYQNATVVSGTEHTFSIFVKAGAVTEVSIRLQALSGSANIVYLYDLALGTGNGYIESFPNGWYRLSGSFTPDTTSGRFYIFISGDQSTYEGNGASLYIWGAQVVQGSPTSYIPTAGAQVTRAADNCVRVLGDEFNPNELTLYYQSGTGINGFENSNSSLHLMFTIIDDSSSYIGFVPDGRFRAGKSGSLFSAPNNWTDVQSGNPFKFAIAISYLTGGVNVAINGVISSYTDTAIPLVSNVLNVHTVSSSDPSEGSYANDTIKDFRVFPEALSEAELITLTGGT